jgi:hypothetical protein
LQVVWRRYLASTISDSSNLHRDNAEQKKVDLTEAWWHCIADETYSNCLVVVNYNDDD